jgi:hypothetical protein
VIDGLQMLAFEAELVHLPRSLIAAVWEALDRLSDMTWRPSEDVDREVRGWMKAKGWEVTRTNYDFDREIYAWRHGLRGGKSPTLRIARYVLEKYPAFIVVHHLELLKVARAIRARPEGRLIVGMDGGRIALKELPSG